MSATDVIHRLDTDMFPDLLRELPQPPTQLYYRGSLPPADLPLIAVVGSRNYTSYGKVVVDHIIGGLAGYRVGIVSGMAIGIDGLAHEAALRHNLYTLAVPGSGLDPQVLYPRRHSQLAQRILQVGGALLTEYEPTQTAATWTFPQRNRIVCGLCVATVIIEAAERSGSLITARLASEYNRELYVVPGDIFSMMSRGTHQFLKLGAIPLTSPLDLIDGLGLARARTAATASTSETSSLSSAATALLATLTTPQHRDELVAASNLSTSEANALLMELELAGYVTETDGMYRRVRT